MNSIKFLFLILLSINLIYLSISQLNGKCGYPGKPYRSKLEPDNKLQYDEGEEVTYQCTEFWSYVKTRKCEKGKWTGEQPRCGDVVKGILMKDSKAEDISDPDNPKKIFEWNNMTIINTKWKYPNVFTSNRFPTARLRIYDTKKYAWSFNFTGPAVKLFVRINFNFINYTLLPQEVRDNFTFNISVNVSPHRKCQLIHQTDDIWRMSGRKTDSDFICDSLSSEDHKNDTTNPPNFLYMETQVSTDITHDLIAVFFGQSYTKEDDSSVLYCGEPEITIAQHSRFNVQFNDYIIDCKSDKYKYISSKNDIIPETAIHGMKCGEDMKWIGSYPECVPKITCPMEHLMIGKHFNQTVVNSLDGLYFYNVSTPFAIEGTEVNYGCLNPTTDILVGKETRICQKNGKWTGSDPHCYDPNESSKTSVWLLIGILFSVLLLVVGATAALFYVYTKRMKTKLKDQISTQKRDDFDTTYDDIDINGDKLYDTTYDVVGDGEVRYADPYYNIDKDYIEMPPNVGMQSSNSYWRLPNNEPAYLEMTSSARNSPHHSLNVHSVNKLPVVVNDGIYTYEL